MMCMNYNEKEQNKYILWKNEIAQTIMVKARSKTTTTILDMDDEHLEETKRKEKERTE